MFLPERNTDSRSRPTALRRNWKRKRTRRRVLRSWFALILLLLAFLAPDRLGVVAHALALVWLGRTETPDLRGDLPDQALVDAFDLYRSRPFAGDLDALR